MLVYVQIPSRSMDTFVVNLGVTFRTRSIVSSYVNDFTVVKSECAGHVEKRMESRLRNLKTTAKLAGKGKLTDVLIRKVDQILLTCYSEESRLKR